MDAALLDILACPKCKGPLTLLGETNPQPDTKTAFPENVSGLSCAACQVVYPIKDNIPVLLIEEAVPKNRWDAAGTRPTPLK